MSLKLKELASCVCFLEQSVFGDMFHGWSGTGWLVDSYGLIPALTCKLNYISWGGKPHDWFFFPCFSLCKQTPKIHSDRYIMEMPPGLDRWFYWWIEIIDPETPIFTLIIQNNAKKLSSQTSTPCVNHAFLVTQLCPAGCSRFGCWRFCQGQDV